VPDGKRTGTRASLIVALNSGTKLGPYEILGALGAGGMGEVYRARDTRLGREVAVKVLPASFSSDADRLRRFEQEARAASQLNHPNIVTVHDFGTHQGAPYVVQELLEGETLRERLAEGAISPRKSVEYAIQISNGLAAAGEKGIVHRDLKPENVFITTDERVKILDFGLAKLVQPEISGSPQGSNLPTMPSMTDPGLVLGTVGYMSPEQVRGKTVDHRSDIFSLGTILYEMLSGASAFRRDSTADTMSAILKEDPPELSPANARISPALDRVVRRCLEKKPEMRFHSASDLAFALEALSAVSGSAAVRAAGEPETIRLDAKKRKALVAALAVAILAVIAVAFWAGTRWATAPQPEFQELTFRRGTINGAAFAPDGQTVVYAAAWEGKAFQLFTTTPQGPESRSLDVDLGDLPTLFTVSQKGELAFDSLGPDKHPMLHVVPLSGGAPRQVAQDVTWADWSPDGTQLAVVRRQGSKFRIEYPIGKVLYETTAGITALRVSPDGKHLAFLDHPDPGDTRGFVSVIDLSGKKTVLTKQWGDAQALAWSPDGSEIWFSAAPSGTADALWAVTLSGKIRPLESAPGRLILFDVSSDGRVLISREGVRYDISALAPGANRERELGWFDISYLGDISRDGKTILFAEQGAGGGPLYTTYLRKTDGSPAVRLGDGSGMSLSPDGHWALTLLPKVPTELQLLPTGAGESRLISLPGITPQNVFSGWLPDGSGVVIAGTEKGHAARLYLYHPDSGKVQPIAPEGYISIVAPLSPDGRWIATFSPEGDPVLCPVAGGKPKKILGLTQGDNPVGWSADSKSLYVISGSQFPITIFKLNLETHRKEAWKTIAPEDPAGVFGTTNIRITPDGKAYAYTFLRFLDDLFLVKGLK
jgi:eukaryotic-like serine/threonine-protein kinase